jgi:hypothetical protein
MLSEYAKTDHVPLPILQETYKTKYRASEERSSFIIDPYREAEIQGKWNRKSR